MSVEGGNKASRAWLRALERTGSIAARPNRILTTVIEELSAKQKRDDDAVREAARLALRRSLKAWHGKRPVIEIHLVRV